MSKTYLYNGPQPTTVTLNGESYKLAPGKAATLPDGKYVAALLDRGLLSTPMPEDLEPQLAPRKPTLVPPMPPLPPTMPDSPRGKAATKGDS